MASGGRDRAGHADVGLAQRVDRGLLGLWEHIGSGQAYWGWARDQRPPVDALYAALFLVGYFAIFVYHPPDLALYSCPPRPENPPDVTVPTFLCLLRWLLVGLHFLPVAAYLARKCPSTRGLQLWYAKHLREDVFTVIRMLPILTAFLSGNVGRCLARGTGPCLCTPPNVSWMLTFLLYTGAYQVSVKRQVWLQAVSTACLWAMPSYLWTLVSRVKLLMAVLAVPCAFAVLLESWVVKEHKQRRRKVAAMCNSNAGESSSAPRDRHPEGKGAPSDAGAAMERPLRVNIAGPLARLDLGDRRGTFFAYKPMVEVRTKMIKVDNEGTVTDEQLVRMAQTFSHNMTARGRAGACTVHKAVAMRGCLLFVAEALEHGREDSLSCSDVEDSKYLVECLPEELRNDQMAVIIGDMKATYKGGKLVEFDKQNRTGEDLEVPEVLLLRPPCVREDRDCKENLEVFMSEAKGDWESLRLVMVYGDSVQQQVDVEHDNLRLEFESEDCTGVAYLHTIGVEGALGTFVGGLAPFLILPGTAAAELNAAFQRTVHCLWSRTADGKSVDEPDSSAPEVIPEAVESKAWSQYFKPFALDMHFLLAPSKEELLDIMKTDGAERDNYLEVFLNVASFLEGTSAVSTEDYLLSRFRDAGIELTHDGLNVSTGSVFPEMQDPYPFDLIHGFCDVQVESRYRYHFSRRQVLMDLAGMVMGLCLLPVVTVLGETGRCLYMCPLVMHLRMSLVGWIAFQNTYITNREPIVFMSWVVRTVAWLGWAVGRRSAVGVSLHPWATSIFLVWTVVVKTIVLKVPFSMHLTVGTADLIISIVGIVLGTWCESWWIIVQGPIVLLCGYVVSLMIAYYSERSDRTAYRVLKG